MLYGTVFLNYGTIKMIHVISTSANIERNYSIRKYQYISGLIGVIEHYHINPFIIETVKRTDYLSEHFTGHSRYSANKGVNELLNIKHFFEEFSNKFNDNDHIIKTSLRYKIISSYFLDQIKNSDFDVYCKRSTDIYGPSDKGVHTFLISMKYRCWLDFLNNNFDKTVEHHHPIEHQISKYVQTQNTKYLDKLDILANPDSLGTIFKV